MSRVFSDVERATIRAFAPVVSSVAKRIAVPLWWDEPESTGGSSRKGGTVCLVHTGEALLGITAAHVHDEIVERLSDGRSRFCQLGAHTFDPRRNVIESDQRLDLATYRLTEIEAASASNVSIGTASVHEPFRARSWPPTPLRRGETCVVGGYPWQLSTEPQDGQRDFDFLDVTVLLEEDEGDWAVLRLDLESSVPYTVRGLPRGTNLGGMSGGPVLRYTEPKGALSAFELCAITSARGSGGDGGVFLGTLARPLSFVLPDGTLKR